MKLLRAANNNCDSKPLDRDASLRAINREVQGLGGDRRLLVVALRKPYCRVTVTAPGLDSPLGDRFPSNDKVTAAIDRGRRRLDQRCGGARRTVMPKPIDEETLKATARQYWEYVFEAEIARLTSTPGERDALFQEHYRDVREHWVRRANAGPWRFGFYEFDVLRSELICRGCGWHGPTKGNFDIYETFMAVDCPTCGGLIATISLPTEDEVRSAAEAGNPRALADAREIDNMKRLGADRFVETMLLASPVSEVDGTLSPAIPGQDLDYGDAIRKEMGISLTATEPGEWAELGICPGRFGCPYATTEEAIAAGAQENFCVSCRVIRLYRASEQGQQTS